MTPILSTASAGNTTRKVFVNKPQTTNFTSNTVNTTKYNPFTFLPLFLFESFRRYSNAFFLFIAALEQIQDVLPTGRWTTLVSETNIEIFIICFRFPSFLILLSSVDPFDAILWSMYLRVPRDAILGVSSRREVFEDLRRRAADNETNGCIVQRWATYLFFISHTDVSFSIFSN